MSKDIFGYDMLEYWVIVRTSDECREGRPQFLGRDPYGVGRWTESQELAWEWKTEALAAAYLSANDTNGKVVGYERSRHFISSASVARIQALIIPFDTGVVR